MTRNKNSTMPDTDFWKEYSRKHPESAEREWEIFSKIRTTWTGSLTVSTPTPEQVERGLTDENWGIRCDWAGHRHYTPTPEQVERGLMDENQHVREAWMQRSREMCDTLLKDESHEEVFSI